MDYLKATIDLYTDVANTPDDTRCCVSTPPWRMPDLDIPDEIDPERSDWEWHVLGGIGLRLPGLPLRGYAEYRYQNVQGDDSPTYSSIYGGLNLYLD